MTVPVQVRPAAPADADAAGEVFLACWHHSYAHLLPPRVRAGYDQAGAVALWRRIFAAAPDGVLVADVPGHGVPGHGVPGHGVPGHGVPGHGVPGHGVRGVTRFGADPDDAGHGHVFSLYVHPQAQGLGLGGRLLRAATARLRSAGYDAATLWVFEANHAARVFYRAHGWVPDGGARVEEAYGEPEVRLRRTLAEAGRGPARCSG